MERVKTGIEGLDKMLGGGLIKGRAYIISGGPGAGKTVMAMRFLMEGTKNKEKGLYVALEEQALELKQDMANFGWTLNNIKIVDTMQDVSTRTWKLKIDSVTSKPEFTLMNLMDMLNKRLETYRPERVVIDSLTSIKMLYGDQKTSRREMLALMNFLSKSACTALLTSETEDTEALMEEFLASGVIRIHQIEKEGETVSAIQIKKMRGMSFDRHIRPMKITDEGVVVFPTESVFS